MIRMEAIHIHEFRGIRDLSLKFGGENFAACGPNGTGKSGIVDAIEFGLTGNLSRLAGSGTGGLSVKHHGPHVDSRNKPEQASVSIDVIIPSLGKKATITRTVKEVGTATITPDEPDIRMVFEQVALHPEFVLSRRELIRYVLSEPGQRSKEVQALLRLDDIEKLRTVLQRIANGVAREVPGLDHANNDARAKLLSALGITHTSSTSVLAAINPNRELLGLPQLASLEANTSLKDGVASAATTQPISRVPKVQAQADLKELTDAFAGLETDSWKQRCIAARLAIEELAKDPKALEDVSRESLLQSSLDLFDGERCPVCDTSWEPEEFQVHLAGKLEAFAETTARRAALEKQLEPIIEGLSTVRTAIATVAAYGSMLKPVVDVQPLTAFQQRLLNHGAQLRDLVPLDQCDAALAAAATIPDLALTLEAIRDGIDLIPEPSKQDSARDFLTVGQERLETYRNAALKLKIAKGRAAKAEKVFEIYGTATTTALEEIYQKVETKFTEFYRCINHSDESEFTARLKPSIGKLGFDVDFYGRGHFPPGAYHSEGHQDGMGLCLYLALM